MRHKSSQLSITSLSTIIFIAVKQLSSEKPLYFCTRHIYSIYELYYMIFCCLFVVVFARIKINGAFSGFGILQICLRFYHHAASS